MSELVLTSHQEEALQWICTRLEAGERLLALRGLAGTGKSTIIPVLRARLAALGLTTQVGAPTHRAAMVLKRKGVRDADTLHAHALAPYFLPEYAAAMLYLGEEVRTREDSDMVHEAHGRPVLLAEHLGDDAEAWAALKRTNRLHGARKALASVGVNGKQYFDGFGPKLGEGCLILDEASMVGREQLDLCLRAFQQVVLVGDPGQLPPVNDVSVLAEIAGFDLTEIHRQAADSPIVQLAYAARRGEAFWHTRFPTADADITEAAWLDPHTLLTSPLLVWRNATRLTCTAAIRAALGYAKARLEPGEPLICRSTAPADREEGFYNNAAFRVVEVSPHDPRDITVQAEGNDETQEVTVHLEEWHGERVDPDAVPFRLGYCLTAHTAQGGEWPSVTISRPDLLAYISRCERYRKMDEVAQWAYTVITRARTQLCFLTEHTFAPPARVPVAAERMKMPPTFAAPVDEPGEPQAPVLTDDIPDNPVSPAVESYIASMPPGRHLPTEALLNQFCATLEGKIGQWVAEQSMSTVKILDAVLGKMVECLEKASGVNEHAQYQLSNTLEKLLGQGVQVRSAPYTVEIDVSLDQGVGGGIGAGDGGAPGLAALVRVWGAQRACSTTDRGRWDSVLRRYVPDDVSGTWDEHTQTQE
jgi:exodeoxyribonuclease-5